MRELKWFEKTDQQCELAILTNWILKIYIVYLSSLLTLLKLCLLRRHCVESMQKTFVQYWISFSRRPLRPFTYRLCVNLKTDPCHRCNLFNPWFRQKNRSRKGEGRSAKMVTLWWKVERRFLRLSWFGYDFNDLYMLCVNLNDLKKQINNAN